MYTLVTLVLPLLVLTVFSVLLIRVYRAQRRRRAAMLRGRRKTASTSSSATSAIVSDEHSVTRVVVVVMVVFAVCNLPAKVFENVHSTSPDCGTLAYVARRLFFVLEVANSTANFVVYCALRRQFRVGLRRALTPLRLRQTDGEDRRRLQRARSVSPVNLELTRRSRLPNLNHDDVDVITVEVARCSHLDVPGVKFEQNTV